MKTSFSIICNQNIVYVFMTTATYTSKGGFFEEPEKEGTAGYRDLMYDVRNGTFTLFTKSYAKIECNMDFGDYPFDTQRCYFLMLALKNSSYQVIPQKIWSIL